MRRAFVRLLKRITAALDEPENKPSSLPLKSTTPHEADRVAEPRKTSPYRETPWRIANPNWKGQDPDIIAELRADLYQAADDHLEACANDSIDENDIFDRFLWTNNDFVTYLKTGDSPENYITDREKRARSKAEKALQDAELTVSAARDKIARLGSRNWK